MKKLNEKGFGVVEGLLVVVIVALLGGAGFYVYNSNKKTSESLNNTGNSEISTNKKSSEETVKVPDLITYEGANRVVIKQKSEVDKLKGASQSFKDYIASLIGTEPKIDPVCDSPEVVTVEKIYKDEFAYGGFASCAGSAAIWKKDGQTWQKIFAGQDIMVCDTVEKYKIPHQISDKCYDIKKDETVTNTY